MTFPPILDWASNNPWLAFFLSCPTSLFLISISWMATSIVLAAWNGALNLVSTIIVSFVTLFRGYPSPAREERETSSDGETS